VSPSLKTVIYPVHDLAQAKAVFTELLGSEPSMDEPYYVQYDAGDQEIGLDPHGHSKGMTGPVGYWHVADLDDALAGLLAAGAKEKQPVTDFGGRRIASVTDADGNVLGLLQPASA
jgi:predicted enzyme related to lactoylglutathione lyase